MTKIYFTDRMLKALKPAPAGERTEIYDAGVPGLMVRVTDKGSKSYAVNARWAGKAAKRTIGSVDRVSLKDARETARAWLELAHQGKDPLERTKQEEALTFGVVMEAFIRRHVRSLRKGRDMEREIRTELMPRFASRPLTEITRRDIAKMVGEIRDRGAVFQAHHILGHARTFFNWAIAQEEFGIEVSPCDRMQPLRLIGPKRHRTRVLSDDELRAVWKAAEQMAYPMGRVWQLLILTGGRRDEVAGALWPEFDLDAKLWTIPPVRFKSERVHVVPLSDDAMDLLEQNSALGCRRLPF